jgi:hypothetical protein
MGRRVFISINDNALSRLAAIAEQERRGVRDQASYMLEQAIKSYAAVVTTENGNLGAVAAKQTSTEVLNAQ